MVRFSPRAVAAFAAVAGFSMMSLAARADEKAPIMSAEAPVVPAAVAAISPVNLAGIVNYCIETSLVSHADGDALQTSLNAKTNAVPPGQAGNVDYAVGSSGEFVVAGAVSTITKLSLPDQGKICTAAVARAKSLI
ncbi:alcohol dehydrogenase [Gluconacetobacter takamatsuzukensis]|uniref:Alcohol dehydrogenase n=1 Tax=Gluconacetobacter takamatsuzukensis TaxID=1286190 RepID=A0A7W4KEM4_9PROT|nr:alcohol dehydrogenase [Gluconacetobacter takamatsuzukensis]MBB2205503.1 alcohol dehydrogenase [Gluconacetobacter takamatsuzukensis]